MLRRAAAAATSVVAALLLPSLPASGAPTAPPEPGPQQEVQVGAESAWPSSTGLPGPRIPVWPGLGRHEAAIALADGNRAVVHVLHHDPSAPGVRLRPELARGGLRGLETVRDTLQRLAPAGAIAGVNGGFWLNNPVGDPNGYFAQDGALVSEAQTQGAGPRGTYVRRADGTSLIDRLESRLTVSTVDGGWSLSVRGLNRLPSQAPPYADLESSAFLYTAAWGETVDAQPVEPGSTAIRVIVLDGVRPPAGNGVVQGVVREVVRTAGEVAIPADGAVLVTMGGSAGAVQDAGISAGQPLQLAVELTPLDSPSSAWSDVVDGLAAGPLLVRGGRLADAGGWSDEGFSPESHSNVRAPRSAIGMTADGHVLLVTVDGRQPGYSHGMTMAELAAYLRSLGAVDAMSLDGGASSQLVVDGVLRNRPCCDRTLRPVADSLVLFRDPYDFASTTRVAGAGREATAAAIAATMHPQGAPSVLLASAGSFPDALAGGPLAVARDAALLLTAPTQLSAATRDALAQLQPGHIILLGGRAAIGTEVEEQLRAQGHEVTRLSGRDRTETAAAVAAGLGPHHPSAFLAAAGGFADALSAASPAGMLGWPILLSGRDSLPDATRAALLDAGTREVVVVGGTNAIGDSVVTALERMGITVTRLAGPSRFATAAAVNRWAAATIPHVSAEGLVVAVGGTFPDALAGGPLAASRRQLLMLVPSWDVTADADADAYLREHAGRGLTHVTLLGGAAVLSDYQRLQLDQLAAAPPG